MLSGPLVPGKTNPLRWIGRGFHIQLSAPLPSSRPHVSRSPLSTVETADAADTETAPAKPERTTQGLALRCAPSRDRRRAAVCRLCLPYDSPRSGQLSERSAETGIAAPSAAGVIDTHRLEAFSDGVMAVIITIMAFELKTPSSADLHGLASRVPSLLVYILSFTVVGIYWNNHHHLLRATRRISAAVMWTNLHLLFWLSLIPFATAWVGTTHRHALPAATYGAVAFGAALAYFALVRAILRANPDDPDIASALGTDIKGIVSPIIYTVGIGLAFVSPYLAYACYAAVSLLWFIPDRRLTGSV